MALSVLDGNQSATTLSSVVTGGEHIVAHSVVSLGSNAISNITTAVSGSTVCVGNLGLLQSTVATEGLSASGSFIKIGGHTGTSTTGHIVHVSAVGALRVDGSVYTQPVSIASVTIGNTVTIAGTVTANPTGTQTIAGTVTAGNLPIYIETDTIVDGDVVGTLVFDVSGKNAFGTNGVTVGSIPSLPAGTNRIGVVTIGGGTVTIGAGTAQIGSVTASVTNPVTVGAIVGPIGGSVFKGGSASTDAIRALPYFSQNGSANYNELSTSNPFPIAGTVTVGNSVTIASLPAISGTVTANTFALQGTAVTTSNFTSTTASTVLAGFNATREVLTIFNEGAGNLHICAGATCTTIAYQVRLSAGDYYEVPNHQTTITHSAVFATAGTARVCQVS